MALRSLPRDKIFVATKVGRYGADAFDFSAERVTKGVHESLERLQVRSWPNAKCAFTVTCKSTLAHKKHLSQQDGLVNVCRLCTVFVCLQTPYIDLIQTHDIEFGDLEQVSCTSLLQPGAC